MEFKGGLDHFPGGYSFLGVDDSIIVSLTLKRHYGLEYHIPRIDDWYPYLGISEHGRELYHSPNPKNYGKCSIKEFITHLRKTHPRFEHIFKHFPGLITKTDVRIERLYAHAQKCKGNKRSRLFAKANRLSRQLNS